MEKYFKNLMTTLIVVIMGSLIVSCSSKEDNDLTVSVKKEWGSSNDQCQMVLDENYQMFLLSVDSLNLAYNQGSRGSFWSGFGVGAADVAGGLAGKYAGRWLGGAVGALLGNPATVIIGAAVGDVAGSIVGAGVASGVANMVLESAVPLYPDFDNGIPMPTSFNCDSLGYYHNDLMVKINSQQQNYMSSNGFDSDLMFQDVVVMSQAYGYYEADFENFSIQTAFLNLVQEFSQLANDYAEGKIDASGMLNHFSRLLVREVNFTTEESQIFVDVLSQIMEGCDQLPVSAIKTYSMNYYRLLNNSSLSTEQKEMIQFISHLFVNSMIIWKQCY